MTVSVSIDSVCVPSDGVVSREIDGDLIIIPLVSGIGDADDELYTLSDSGRAIWRLLDGRLTLAGVAARLADDFEGSPDLVRADVVGFATELTQRGILTVIR